MLVYWKVDMTRCILAEDDHVVQQLTGSTEAGCRLAPPASPTGGTNTVSNVYGSAMFNAKLVM